ncbi:cobalamin biosynthesis protein CobW [Tenacibaculum finnmarkense]|uniref:Cobalamin biosynthesis protein CobW n=1 Tax=Tenacibaculum finnmarkense genomovar finnmarkense TaxID=1458503 RepID=A0AAP1WFV5_9FLAO|nr:cobalamin biosynthesis protein CobW [Tenacibaculum finnmarkense]MBE7652515.1 cobalamin biosynthesis protein CobW [Tenacibaculum finnmarkense genomovar finnmarkense]MBE7694675.1 cobalamin biosynthesis protein CobW [Tenacibaculum finnmarkense genomovar finnmarkense]MCD8427000.1 cobalamin biosynthesis protein CobW [Tenacibaculum finnmarkense genomovar finnmarkense]MCG8731136.1 cobalamin biosynthesis protein CobW [Tenacibaculum finnmarkense]MCG8752520.1 cobalamin biosynthesis protein CobW [Tena
MNKKIPITIVTGFLGVGKTTLVHNMLKNANGKRIAVLVNEFGEVDVDGQLIASSECGEQGCNLVQLPNGCICCTVQEEFLPSMLQLLERKEEIDHIVIETSGLSMPKPLVKAVNWPDLKPHITIDAVITVVDAVGIATGEICDRERVQAQRLADDSLDHETPIEELFLDQLGCADLVLVSKRDLVDDEKFEEIEKLIAAKARPNIKIIPVENGKLDNTLLLGIEASAEDDVDNRHSIHEEHHKSGNHHHHNDDIKTVLLEYSETSDIKAFVKDLKKLVEDHEIYRIKGFVNIPNKPMRMVLQGVGARFDYYFERPWGANEERKTSIVVIGKNIELTKNNEVITHSHSHGHSHAH